MLKTTRSTRSGANPRETKDGVGGNSMVGNVIGGGEATNPTKGKNPVKMTKSKNHDFPKFRPEEAGTSFLTSEARLTFTQLKQAFVEAPIFHHLDLESHIRIVTDVSGYAIGSILSQLYSKTQPDGVVIKNNLGQ